MDQVGGGCVRWIVADGSFAFRCRITDCQRWTVVSRNGLEIVANLFVGAVCIVDGKSHCIGHFDSSVSSVGYRIVL